MRKLRKTAAALLVATGACICASASSYAVVIDMEGIAPAGGLVTDNNTTRAINGFNVSIDHGHYWDSAHPQVGVVFADSGTDWLEHDDTGLLTLTKVGGGSFSIQAFDASMRAFIFNGNSTRNHTIDVVGTYALGGTTSTSFTVDDLNPFETFSFGSGWTGLSMVTFQNPTTSSLSGGNIGYDNIVVDMASIPEPGTLAILAVGLIGLGCAARKRAV